MSTPAEPVITKRKVTMRSATLLPDGQIAETRCEDYVRPDFLDAYVADARTRWQVVEVSAEPDAGPAGYDGPTHIPAGLAVPNAGTYYPPTPGTDVAEAYAEQTAAMVADPAVTVVEG